LSSACIVTERELVSNELVPGGVGEIVFKCARGYPTSHLTFHAGILIQEYKYSVQESPISLPFFCLRNKEKSPSHLEEECGKGGDNALNKEVECT
jgi:hypothetical protein